MTPAPAAAVVERSGATLRVSGALVRAVVARVHAQALGLRAGIDTLDLSGLTALDSAGLACLSALVATGAPAPAVVPPPPGVGLDELRAAYRLDSALDLA